MNLSPIPKTAIKGKDDFVYANTLTIYRGTHMFPACRNGTNEFHMRYPVDVTVVNPRTLVTSQSPGGISRVLMS